ncbi:hypothetical protein SAMN04487948_11810 [Halogranum amylolyticum]|uniref:Membrane protein YesL n=1 Tax=Halogranum amylolyticum TaxID=660520 RepID=A0A1H8VMS9_9EURY|nr:hypothetical protein [Halogranum amylolyticum]SEP16705.1 hypothetical protein SAMN04487948_11810 [Halogranum amylolyticum]
MTRTDQHAFRWSVVRVPGFVYHNGLRITLLSLAWTVASLPLVTIGPATLAAYVALGDLRSDRNAVDWSHTHTVLRRNGVASAVFSGVPVVFGAIAVTYGLTALREGSLAGEVVALVAGYIALYLALALIPTFVALSKGAEPVAALRYGIGWLAKHPTAALSMGLLTLAILALCVLLTIGFALLFAGLAFSLHIVVVEAVDEAAVTAETTPAVVPH